MKTRSVVATLVLGFALPLSGAPAVAAMFNHSAFDAILQHYVGSDGFVDYGEIRENAASGLESYLEQLKDVDLAGWQKNERLAFWINAYNAIAMEAIVRRPKLKKISDDFDFMNEPVRVGGRNVSMNDIKFRVLLNRTNPDNKKGPIDGVSIDPPDPRALFALSCGAVGDAPLRNSAYTDDNVDTALEIAAKNYVNSQDHVALDNGHLVLSRLFRSHRRDFESLGGVAAYISSLIDPDRRSDAEYVKGLLKTNLDKTVYQFDWTVDDVHSNPRNQDKSLAPSL